MAKLLCIFAIFFVYVAVFVEPKFAPLSRMRINNFQLVQCNSRRRDPVSVENVSVQIGDHEEFVVSGSMCTDVELTSSIKAELVLKKKLGFMWITVPCRNSMGSCTFQDLCAFGIPEDKVCPQHFIDNGVPCRCPISQGNYTLPPISFSLSQQDRSVATGKYKGNVVISDHDGMLACYNMNFYLSETQDSH